MQYMIYLDQPISADKILFHPNSSKSYSVQLQGSSRVQKAGCTPTIKVTGSVELWLLQVSQVSILFWAVDLRTELVITSASSSAIVGFFPDYVITWLV